MRALADVSWLLPLCHGRHQHHVTALTWLDSLPERDGILICRVAQLGLLRLLTNPTVMGPDVCDTGGAWKLNDRLMADDRFEFVLEPHGLEDELRRLTRGFGYSPKLWQDSYLGAFSLAARASLVTFDTGFREYKGVRSIILTG